MKGKKLCDMPSAESERCSRTNPHRRESSGQRQYASSKAAFPWPVMRRRLKPKIRIRAQTRRTHILARLGSLSGHFGAAPPGAVRRTTGGSALSSGRRVGRSRVLRQRHSPGHPHRAMSPSDAAHSRPGGEICRTPAPHFLPPLDQYARANACDRSCLPLPVSAYAASSRIGNSRFTSASACALRVRAVVRTGKQSVANVALAISTFNPAICSVTGLRSTHAHFRPGYRDFHRAQIAHLPRVPSPQAPPAMLS